MPARQPFTALCAAMARPLQGGGRADLHVHTDRSDGVYTPEQIVDLARRCGLAAVAVTDHDTLAGVETARTAAAGKVEVITGVEITTEHRGRELHLLAYFVDPQHEGLKQALEQLRADRVTRFHAMVERLRTCGVSVDEDDLPHGDATLGRRHLAEALVRQRRAGSVREAFVRYLADGGRADVPKRRLPVAEAVALVRDAGGVSAWAHPPGDATPERLRELCEMGLDAVEVDFPGCRPSRTQQLRRWAAALGLAVTGGSDCHGPGDHRRAVGARGVSADELRTLREKSAACGLAPANR